MLPHIAWFAILNGPRVPSSVTAKDLLAKALEWERRTGAEEKRRPDGDDEPWDPGAALDGGDDVSQLEGEEEAIPPPTPEEIRDGVVAAAVELSRAWQDDVMAGVPSRFLFALSGVADRGAYLLDEVAPDLAKRFLPVLDVFMRHSQYGDPRPPEELARAVDELESLLDAVVRRAFELSTGRTVAGP